ncbi:MAG: ferrous iron transport protein B [Candidatus Omnitrophica bacterium]|nr:ferrous iron transport protein B [Candidatus Omnitrophota bacterium]
MDKNVSQEKKTIIVGLCGNPNAGKTSIFNALTGSRQHVGNYAGVTVESKEGIVNFEGYQIKVVDLPGTYSLTAYSIEEIVARDFILREPDVVINIVDSTNLDRNLYLTTQLIELGARAVIALNMNDEAEHKGIKIDRKKLGELLGMPVVPTVGSRGHGMKELLQEVVNIFENKEPIVRHLHISYGNEVEEEIKKIQAEIRKDSSLADGRLSTRWLSVKLLEGDNEIVKEISATSANKENILKQADSSRKHIEGHFSDDCEIIIADRRYGFIKGLLLEAYSHLNTGQLSISDKIDRVMTNRILGIPILLGLLWIMFQATYTLGAYPQNWINSFVGIISHFVNGIMPAGLLRELVVDGMIGGVGGVLAFLPNIMLLFLFISFFEDTGYLARAAFIMDRIMHTLGLHGKSFIPMIMAFGCNVPGIMATRTLENKTDRMITILINPLVSCSARLPVYVLLAGVFFGKYAGNVIFAVYLTGIVLAILIGQIFRKTLFKGGAAPFVMELPPYRLPMLKSVIIHMWEKGSIFLQKVGGIILAASIVIWFISAFPRNVAIQDNTERLSKSYAGQMGKFIEPAIKPLGFDWRGGIALITGVAAKEIVVSTFGVLYQTGADANEKSAGLKEAVKKNMKPLSALAFMFFTLIYIPCLGALGAMYRELGSLKWTLFAVSYSLTLAWIVAFIIYQGGSYLGLGA